MDEKELAFLRKRHVEDTSLTEMNGACRCGSLVFPCQTSRLVAEVDRLRTQVAAVESVLEEEDHGLLCNSHYYRNPCSCWHAKVAKITGYGYE